ncbi:MAG: (Fe-S)-binding protein [Caldisphaera sp.]
MYIDNLLKYREMAETCARCGYCRDMVRSRDNTYDVCPLRGSTAGFDLYTARGKNWIVRLLIEHIINPDDITDDASEIIYSCTLCGNCTTHCLVLKPDSWSNFPANKFNDHLINNNETNIGLRSVLVNNNKAPKKIQEVLQNFYLYGNALGLSTEKGMEWSKGLKLKYAGKDKSDTLLYIGTVANYYKENYAGLISMVNLLKKAEVNFVVLDSPLDSGGDIRELGEEALFEEFARKNLEIFKQFGIKRIITVSPHDYNAFKNYYPNVLGKDWEEANITVYHYTEFFNFLIKSGKLKINKKFDLKFTYHDPCKLGRINGIYEEPRSIIASLGSLKEMELNKENSYCCGGGGGGLWYETSKPSRMQDKRIKQAIQTGADVLVTACPSCKIMLENGLKNINGKIMIKDIAEVLNEAI